jgi:hypothetical protein
MGFKIKTWAAKAEHIGGMLANLKDEIDEAICELDEPREGSKLEAVRDLAQEMSDAIENAMDYLDTAISAEVAS